MTKYALFKQKYLIYILYATLLLCLGFVLIIIVQPKKSNNDKYPWLIDYPIYGIRLGDKISNIPNHYILTDYVEGTNLVFFKSPYEDIKEVSVLVDEKYNIYSLGFTYRNSSLETFKKITDEFSNSLGQINIEFDDSDKEDIKANGFCVLDFDGKLVGIAARRIGKSSFLPDGQVSMHYAHQDLLHHYMQRGKPTPAEDVLRTLLKPFSLTDQRENTAR